jgi:hypothetical protein
MDIIQKKIFTISLLAALLVFSSTAVFQVSALVPPNWNVTGSYAINVEYLGVNYQETLTLTQTGSIITGDFLDTIPPTGAGGQSYFVVTDGSVAGNDIVIVCQKAGGPTVTLTGTIDGRGFMSGTWADTSGGLRTGTWATTAILSGMFQLPESPIGTATFVLSAFLALVVFAGIRHYRNRAQLFPLKP